MGIFRPGGLAAVLATVFLTTAAAAQDLPISPQISGSWFDPARSGEGFVFEIANDPNAAAPLFVAYWYTYDPQGNQMYLFGATPLQSGQNRVTVPLQVTDGASFGEGFDPADVVQAPWGALDVAFHSCNRGTITYAPDDASRFGQGSSLALTRLTSIAAFPCQEDAGACAAVAGSYAGTLGELYCDAVQDINSVDVRIDGPSCAIRLTYLDTVIVGTVSGNTFEGGGSDPSCGTIKMSGTVADGKLNGQYLYSGGGVGFFSAQR